MKFKSIISFIIRLSYRIIIPFMLMRGCTSFDKMKTIYSWKALEFAFSNEQHRHNAIQQGEFIPGAPLPIDVDFYYKAKQGSTVFMTIPRIQKGVPVTLGYVTNNVSPEGNPIIAPYPSWEWNKLGNCNGITSAFRVQVDSCDRLWVIDTGRSEEQQICSPQLLAFSLRTNKIITQYKIPKNQYEHDSLFVTIAVDIRDVGDKCRDTFIYIADVTGFGLLVYDHRNSRSWRITNNLFFPYPPYGTYNIKGDEFDLMDGVIGLALSPIKQDGDRILYFHSLASRVESWVPTSTIRNHSLFQDHSNSAPRSFRPFSNERSSQSAAQAMDKNGILFFGLLSDISLACWNSITHPEYGGNNIDTMIINRETLQFPSGVKVITAKNGREELWVLTSAFQRFMTSSIKSNETNFRILAGYVEELTRGTKCQSGRYHHDRGYNVPPFPQ